MSHFFREGELALKFLIFFIVKEYFHSHIFFNFFSFYSISIPSKLPSTPLNITQPSPAYSALPVLMSFLLSEGWPGQEETCKLSNISLLKVKQNTEDYALLTCLIFKLVSPSRLDVSM